MTKKVKIKKSVFPESAIYADLMALGTDRDAYDALKRLRGLLSDRMASIWHRKPRRSAGRTRSLADQSQRDLRLAGFLAKKSGRSVDDELKVVQAHRSFAAAQVGKDTNDLPFDATAAPNAVPAVLEAYNLPTPTVRPSQPPVSEYEGGGVSDATAARSGWRRVNGKWEKIASAR